MKIHVFCSDFLPGPGLPATGGGLRSQQILSLMQRGGFDVSWSVPAKTFIETKFSEGRGRDPAVRYYDASAASQLRILYEEQADVAIYCYATMCRLDPQSRRLLSSKIVFDVHGPIFLEASLVKGENPRNDMLRFMDALKIADGIFTVSEAQRAGLFYLLAGAGRVMDRVWSLRVPVSIAVDALPRNLAPEPELLFCGSFYPWQDPVRGLATVASVLEKARRGKLVIAGGTHGHRGDQKVERFFKDVADNPHVEVLGFLPRSELTARYARAWSMVELMEYNLERRFAMTTRTIEQLSCGLPVVYNDYSYMSELIAGQDAGWTCDLDRPETIEAAVHEVLAGGDALDRKSANASRLAASEFTTDCVEAEVFAKLRDLVQSGSGGLAAHRKVSVAHAAGAGP